MNLKLLLSLICLPLLFANNVSAADKPVRLDAEKIDILHEIWRAKAIAATMGNYTGHELTKLAGLADASIQPLVINTIQSASHKVLNENNERFYQSLAPLYLEYFTRDELMQLVKFYNSDLGQKLYKVQGPLAQDIMKAAQDWRESMEMEIQNSVYRALAELEDVRKNPEFYKIVKQRLGEK